MNKKLSLLGSTGSIGTQALEVVREMGDTVTALAAHHNVDLLERQIREFTPRIAAVYDENAARSLKIRVADLPVRVLSGMDGLCEAAVEEQADVVLNAVVGMVGLKPTLCAVGAGKDIALANKETLVAGGALVMRAAAERGVRLLPVDSEHSAIFQCLEACRDRRDLSRILLTASGGPFFGKSAGELQDVTPAAALRHPNWSMGAKITIDSATMMNKGLEVIEAAWLFDLPEDRIDVVVHRESIIHSMIEFTDHSVLAQLGVPDMKIPIQYALTWPRRAPSSAKRLDLAALSRLTFFPPDDETFTCLAACREAIRRGGLAPAAANGANEAAVDLFLNGKISFLDIGALVREAMLRQKDEEITSLEDILNADRNARAYVTGAAGCGVSL